MALINCPECNGVISDKARSCPHCGYPIHEDMVNNVIKKFDLVLNSISSNQELKLRTIKTIREIKGLGLSEATKLINNLPSTILFGIEKNNAIIIQQKLEKMGCKVKIEETSYQSASEQDAADEFISNIGKLVCPRCRSTAVTTGTKGYGLIRGFLGSNKTVNRCGSCGYSWEP